MLTLPTLGVIGAAWSAWSGDTLETVNLVVFVVLWASTLFAIEAGYHRYFSHRAFRATPAFEYALALLGSMAFQGPVIWWAAMHRRHHEHSDQPGDPHSPHLRGTGHVGALAGLWDAHMGWLFAEVDSISRKSTWARYVPDLLDNPRIWSLHRHYLRLLVLGISLPAVVGGLATWSWHGAWMGFLWGGLVRVFLVNHAIWAVNSICHVYGRRPFALHARDRSTNNAWVAAISFGAGWHHNHHTFPGSATTSMRPSQIDVSGLALAAFARLGWVSDLRTPPDHASEVGWARRVELELDFEGRRLAGSLAGLSLRQTFVELDDGTPSALGPGARVELVELVVAEAGRRGKPASLAALDGLTAEVERVGFQGAWLRFDSPSPEALAALGRLRARAALDEPEPSR
ncbi:Fatty acid desaturase [Enhygromyxa salina]|uniref:Fatty acid desaturase n=1 Tax=Enhygromyxa salina TaxID=215803 RepID=A0A2S9XK30_9BACT|nr:Fatty acid desaturase [Enhygromyxa salina]